MVPGRTSAQILNATGIKQSSSIQTMRAIAMSVAALLFLEANHALKAQSLRSVFPPLSSSSLAGISLFQGNSAMSGGKRNVKMAGGWFLEVPKTQFGCL